MTRLHAPDGTALSVFTDGEIVIQPTNGEEVAKSFENLGTELELEIEDPYLGVSNITIRLTDAKVAKSREVVENES